MRWVGGQVWVEDAVDAPRPPAVARLRDSFLEETAAMTLGLVRERDGALVSGPVELLRFGAPETNEHGVAWPIAGGVLAAAPGGRLRVFVDAGRLVARVEGYRPALPRSLYSATQLVAHHILVRLVLLRMRGRVPAAAVPADVSSRMAAGAIDVALCAGLTLLLARRRRLRAFAAITAGYHVAAWAVSGRTVGGALMRQRVVSVDGSPVTAAQAVLRFISLPFAALRMRAIHDDVAETDVISQR
ncbi:MAG TPA: RDD family protein [Candidatus Dormibacteraeota bacterium]|nr:RDD family protein [Candidatus Dormibacteraeota bacterium]